MCPVCGFLGLNEPPRSPETGGGSYEICPSCGFEFGVTDDDQGITYMEWRERWIATGMHWYSRSYKAPSDWDPNKQVAQLKNRP